MPMIDVYAAADVFPAGSDRQLAEELTRALLRAEGDQRMVHGGFTSRTYWAAATLQTPISNNCNGTVFECSSLYLVSRTA